MKLSLPALLASSIALTSVTAALAQGTLFQTESMPVEAETIADGLRHPWGLDFLPSGEAIVTERPGQMRILLRTGKLSEPVSGLPEVAAAGQGGLLDVAVAPDFETSSLIAFSFSQPGQGGAGTAVARARLARDGEAARLEDVQVIFSMARKTPVTRHFGSRLVFAPDGTLFISTGDRGEPSRAQDMNDHAGAIIRIKLDGTIPSDNPSTDATNHLAEIWSKGHRNPQGMTWDPVLAGLVTAEHGDKGGDEINLSEAGKNYGWPIISYGVTYAGRKIGVGTDAPGFEQPLFYWDPSIAPSGLASYQGSMFPEWRGDLIVGSLKFGLISRLDRDDAGKILGEERMFEGEFGRIRDVNVAPDGSIWLLTDEADGQIVRLSAPD